MSDMLDTIRVKLVENGVDADVFPGDNVIFFRDNNYCKPSEMGM